MAMRGRRPDHPALQAAKGHPGKRKTKAERQVEQANEVAALLMASPAEPGDPFAPPAFLVDPRCAGALAVWREYVPHLAKLNLIDMKLDRHTFATFCVYVAEFAEAHNEIQANGYSRNVRTVSGDLMPRVNPNVERRDTAHKHILDLAKRFGLTAVDRFNLLSTQRSVLSGLGGGAAASAPPAREEGGQPSLDMASPIGALDGLDSAPPDARSH